MEKTFVIRDSTSGLMKVLVVDERLSARKELVDWLQQQAHVQTEGLSPGESLAALQERDFDLVLVGRIGHRRLLKELVHSVRAHNPKVVVAIAPGDGASDWLKRQADGVLQH